MIFCILSRIFARLLCTHVLECFAVPLREWNQREPQVNRCGIGSNVLRGRIEEQQRKLEMLAVACKWLAPNLVLA